MNADKLLAMLAKGRDDALLRFSLGNVYMRAGEAQQAVEHLRAAVAHDPAYSAAWKLLGKALTESGALGDALQAYEDGVAAATAGGDLQAAKEMQVFAKRVRKQMA